MIVSVKGIDLKADYSIRTLVNIVEYKKRYEPHNKISLTGYIQQATNEEYSLDTVVDILFYPYAINCKKIGVSPSLTYEDVAVHIIENPELVGKIVEDLLNSMDVKDEGAKKKTVKK